MKKIIAFLSAILLSLSAWAVPARPGVYTYTQPDGTVVRLERHGDEFFNWTTLAGTTQAVARDADGFWRPCTLNPAAREAARERRARANNERLFSVSQRTHTENPITHGERHIPVVLVNFSDVSFSIDNPQERFHALLNQNGYSENGGTGSVQDFYVDNSKGQFRPVFDVYGPVTVPHEMAYYGENVVDNMGRRIGDKQPELALYHAALLLDETVDFSIYDYDHDGFVDMTLFYYAGYNEAEWAPEDTIWPHQWTIQSSSLREARNALFDGLKLGAYFCTSELKGNKDVNMCGIGTTCHEFGHSLGLPDFYDTDYEENGQTHALGGFSTMCSGSYNNDGRTPPYFNAEERIYLGWMIDDDIKELPAGPVSFGSVKDDIAYKTLTDTEGEYFLYECRDGSGWDAPLPQGLLVYHADKSTTRTVGGITPYMHWNKWSYYNSINADGSHPCFYVVPAANQKSLNYSSSDPRSWVFPGSSNTTTYSPIDWEGYNTGVTLSDISYADKRVSLSTTYSLEKKVVGKVSDSAGNGVEGVCVVLTKKSAPSGAPRLRQVRPRAPHFETMTDASGSFTISIDEFGATEGHITISKEGYQTGGKDVQFTGRVTVVDLSILKEGELDQRDYFYFDIETDMYVSGYPNLGNSQMAAIRIPASELSSKGGHISFVEFAPYYQADAYYVIVDAGDKRILTYEVPGLTGGDFVLTRVNLESLDVVFPGGEDLYVGYAVKNAQAEYNGYPFIIASGSNTYYSGFDLEHSRWDFQEDDGYGLVFKAHIINHNEPVQPVTSFTQMGIGAIADPKAGEYTAGEVFKLELELPDGVVPTNSIWTLDGASVSGEITLGTGRHHIVAAVTYADSSEEVFELVIDVK